MSYINNHQLFVLHTWFLFEVAARNTSNMEKKRKTHTKAEKKNVHSEFYKIFKFWPSRLRFTYFPPAP